MMGNAVACKPCYLYSCVRALQPVMNKDEKRQLYSLNSSDQITVGYHSVVKLGFDLYIVIG